MPTPIAFDGHNVVIAKDQPPYIPLPAYFAGDEAGTCLTCWEFTDDELEMILRERKVWVSLLTFNQPFQPLAISVDAPVISVPVELPPASYKVVAIDNYARETRSDRVHTADLDEYTAKKLAADLNAKLPTDCDIYYVVRDTLEPDYVFEP